MSEVETDVMEVLEPSVPDYEEEIGGHTFIQRPLSFFGKIELFSVMAEAMEKALAEGFSLGELLDELPSSASSLNAKEISETDVLVKSLANVIKVAPELLEDIFAISFRIKRSQREEFKELIEEVSDEQALRILNNFINQNWDAIRDFFSKQGALKVVENVSKRLQSESTLSTPSKPSQPRTKKK